jgi:hypothetical protein
MPPSRKLAIGVFCQRVSQDTARGTYGHCCADTEHEAKVNRPALAALVIGAGAMILWLGACRGPRDEYTVIGRTNSNDSLVFEVPVILEHDGHKYYARCNNVKGVKDPKVTRHCDLHVGMKVHCQFFTSRDTNGYDLICGEKRNEKADLDTYGENELLFIDREEQ